MLIKQVESEYQQNLELLDDDEGPEFTVRCIGANHYIISTRKKQLEQLPEKVKQWQSMKMGSIPFHNWMVTISNWCGLYTFDVHASREAIIHKLCNLFKTEIVWSK